MKANHVISLLQENYTTCRVVFSERNTADTPQAVKPQSRVAAEQKTPWVDNHFNMTDFERQRAYAYKVLLTDAVQVGDSVVVPHHRDGLAVATVVAVDIAPQIDVESDIEYKWIVQKVDKTRYDQIVASEAQFHAQMEEARRTAVRQQLKQQYFDSFPEGSPMREALTQSCTSLNQVLSLAAEKPNA